MASFEDLRPLPGGRLSLDLLNTRWNPPGGPVDWLEDDKAVSYFAASHGLELEPSEIEAARSALVRARELIKKLFQSATEAQAAELDEVVAAEVNNLLKQADVRLSTTDGRPHVLVSSNDSSLGLAVEATVDAVAVVGERLDRLRTCRQDDCSLWFLDTSKGGRRRWCSMESCGNRAKARRHYSKATSGEEVEEPDAV